MTRFYCVVTSWILELLHILLSFLSTYLLQNTNPCVSCVLHFCSVQALMKEVSGNDYLAIAWEYPNQTLEVVPATHSRITRPGWPVTCLFDSDCDDGIFCNGMLLHHWLCFHLVCMPHQNLALYANVYIWIHTFHAFIR